MRSVILTLLAALLGVAASVGCARLESGSTPSTEPDESFDPRSDTDKDGVPDLVERFSGTDPQDEASLPRTARAKGECPTGWSRRDTLCFSQLSSWPRRYRSASLQCRGMAWYYRVPIRVATYEDLSYLYLAYPQLAASYDPKGRWIGNIVGDDRVLCGNRHITGPDDSDIYNFEGSCSKNGERRFWCVMDLGLYEATH